MADTSFLLLGPVVVVGGIPLDISCILRYCTSNLVREADGGKTPQFRHDFLTNSSNVHRCASFSQSNLVCCYSQSNAVMVKIRFWAILLLISVIIMATDPSALRKAAPDKQRHGTGTTRL